MGPRSPGGDCFRRKPTCPQMMACAPTQGQPMLLLFPFCEVKLPGDLGTWPSGCWAAVRCRMVWEGGHPTQRWAWELSERLLILETCLWDDDCLHPAMSEDQKGVERSLLLSGHVENICLQWRPCRTKQPLEDCFQALCQGLLLALSAFC